MDVDLRWNLDGDALSLRLVDLPWSHTPADFKNEQVFNDRVWTRIEEPLPSAVADAAARTTIGMPPDGVYRMKLSLEEALAAGASRESAINDLAGVNTLEIDGERGIWRLRPSESGSRGPRDDGLTISLKGDRVSFDGSATGYRTVDKLTWTFDGTYLTFDVLEVRPAAEFAFDSILLETKPWERIADHADLGDD